MESLARWRDDGETEGGREQCLGGGKEEGRDEFPTRERGKEGGGFGGRER